MPVQNCHAHDHSDIASNFTLQLRHNIIVFFVSHFQQQVSVTVNTRSVDEPVNAGLSLNQL